MNCESSSYRQSSENQFALEWHIIWTIKNVLCLRQIDCVCALSIYLSIYLYHFLFLSYSQFKVHPVNSNRLSIAFSIQLLFHDCHQNSIQHNHSQQLDFRENKYTSVYFNLKLQMHFVILFVTKINIKQQQQLKWEFTSSFHLRFICAAIPKELKENRCSIYETVRVNIQYITVYYYNLSLCVELRKKHDKNNIVPT